MSVAMAATRALVRGRSRLSGQSVGDKMAELTTRDYPAHAPVPRRMRRDYRVTEDTLDGCAVLRLVPVVGASGEQVLYTHGGSYVHPLAAEQWWFVERVLRDTGATLTVPLYRLAPEGGVDRAYEFLRPVYEELAAAGPVTLVGDSAGGGLALGQAVAHRDAGLPAPRQVVLIAPWVDVSLENPAVAALQPLDPMLDAEVLRACGRFWAGDRDLRDPLVSPLFADLSGLPPVHTFQGGRDLLAGDVGLLAGRLREAGNPGRLTLVPDAFHVYVAAFWTPEARDALRTINRLLRE